jgi:pimeloyl-ACP methyl ester carboxylesterase
LAEAVVSVGGAIYQFGDVLAMRGVLRLILTRPLETAAIVAEILTAGLRAPSWLRRCVASSSLLRRVFLAPYVLHPAALPADAAALIIDGAGASGVYPTARAVGRSNLSSGIQGATCPILSLAADADRITPLRDTFTLQRELPHAHTVVLEGCGHMLMLERPQAFNAELLSYAAALPTPPTTTAPKESP